MGVRERWNTEKYMQVSDSESNGLRTGRRCEGGVLGVTNKQVRERRSREGLLWSRWMNDVELTFELEKKMELRRNLWL